MEGVVYIAGSKGISYTVPYLNYSDTDTFSVKIHVGTQGYTTTDMDFIVASLVERAARNNLSFTMNKVEAAAFDELYAASNKYTKNKLSAMLRRNNNNNKANAWETWYAQYSDVLSETYSPSDMLYLDMILAKQMLAYVERNSTGILSDGYDRIYSGQVVSSTRLQSMYMAARTSALGISNAAAKAIVWNNWYNTYTRSEYSVERTPIAKVVTSTKTFFLSVADKNTVVASDLLDEDGNLTRNIFFNGSTTEATKTAIHWVDLSSLLAEINRWKNYNGNIVNSEAFISDYLFGQQLVHNAPIHINTINIKEIVYNQDLSKTDRGYSMYYNDGRNGVRETGSRNTYVFIRYSANANGTNFSSTPNDYIGIAVVADQPKTSSYADVAATLTKESFLWYSNTDNIFGENGNYEHRYVHIRYSDNKTDLYADIDAIDVQYGKYIGIYFGSEMNAENLTAADYTWYGSVYESGSINVNPYDEKTIDEALNIYLAQVYSTVDSFAENGDVLNKSTIFIQTEYSGANQTAKTQAVPYSSGIWELATEIRADGREYVVWEYVNDTNGNGDYTDDGIKYNGNPSGATSIRVLVRSRAQSGEDQSNRWQFWVEIDLANVAYNANRAVEDPTKRVNMSLSHSSIIRDATVSRINNIAAVEVVSGRYESNNITIGSTLVNGKHVISINPYVYDLTKDVKVGVSYLTAGTGELYAHFNAADFKDFYQKEYIETTLTFGEKTNCIQTVDVILRNESVYWIRKVDNISYYRKDGATRTDVAFDEYNWSAFEDINNKMPNKAEVTCIADGEVKIVTLDVKWTKIEAYDSYGLTSSGSVPRAYAKIGNDTFGYIEDVVELHIYPERFETNDVISGLPDGFSVFLDPYDATNNEAYMKSRYTSVRVSTTVATKKTDGEWNWTDEVIVQEKNLSVVIDSSNINYKKYRDGGFKESKYTIYFNIGSTVTDSYGISFDVRYSVDIVATLWSRRITNVFIKDGSGAIIEPTGNMYDRIDFDSYTYWLLYGSGSQLVEMTDSIVWEGIDDIEYTPGGGTYYITASIGEGDLKQSTEVKVVITKAQLISLGRYDIGGTGTMNVSGGDYYIDNNTMLRYRLTDSGTYELDSLRIEPFIGFVGYGTLGKTYYEYFNADGSTARLPDVRYGSTDDYSGYGLPEKIYVNIETDSGMAVRPVYVDWEYDTVQEVMSISGGTYDKDSTVRVVLAVIYDLDSKGNRINEQKMKITTVVEDRSVQYYSVSFDGEHFVDLDDIIYTTYNGGAGSSYELLLNPYNMENAMSSNPYARPSSAAYSENFGDSNFSYFRSVKVNCAGGYTVLYNLRADNYSIYDASTGYATDKSNLYAGKNVNIRLTVGRSESIVYIAVDGATAENAANNGYYVRVKGSSTYIPFADRDVTQVPSERDCLYENDGEELIYYKKEVVMSSSGTSAVSAKDACELTVTPKTYGKTGENTFEDVLKVRILDMRYKWGNGLGKDVYYIDRYGVIQQFDNKVEYSDAVFKIYIKGADADNYYLANSSEVIVGYLFEQLSYDGTNINVNKYTLTSITADGNGGIASISYKKRTGAQAGKPINYGGGVGCLTVTFGNRNEIEIGGEQTYDIPIVYVDRTVKEIVYVKDVNTGLDSNMPNYDPDKGMFVFDPFVTYSNSENGFDSEKAQGYFVGGQYSATLKFATTTIDRVMATAGSNGDYFNYSLFNQSLIGVTINDEPLYLRVGGGTYNVYAWVGAGEAKQVVPLKVLVRSRTVGLNENNIVSGDGFSAQCVVVGGEKVYYYAAGNVNYEIYNGVTVNVFNNDLLTTSNTGGRDLNGNPITVNNLVRLNRTEFAKALSVYDFMGESGISAKIIAKVFNTTSGSTANRFYVFYQGFSHPVGYDMYKDAVASKDAANSGYTFLLSWEEKTGVNNGVTYTNGINMQFKVDNAYGLSYKGTAMKLYLTIPGYAMGKKGQQKLYIELNQNEQYIITAAPSRGVWGSTDTLELTTQVRYSGTLDSYGTAWVNYFADHINYLNLNNNRGTTTFEGYDEGDIFKLYDSSWSSRSSSERQYVLAYNKKTGRFTINSPYYYIINGNNGTTGFKMPDYIQISVGTKRQYLEYQAAVNAFNSVGSYTEYQELSAGTAWAESTYYAYNGDGTYSLLQIMPDDWTTGTYYRVDQTFTVFTVWYSQWLAKNTLKTYAANSKNSPLSVIWSGGSSNYVTVNYNDTSVTTTFNMSLDDQVYRMTFDSVRWLFENEEGEKVAFESTDEYGPEDIIMMPTREDASDYLEVLYRNTYTGQNFSTDHVYDPNDSSTAIKYDEYYGYRLRYTVTDPFSGEEKTYTVTVHNITGGGTFRNSRNKWYFGNVDFYSSKPQYARITIGGKGGQVLLWEFSKLNADRKLINSNVPSICFTDGYFYDEKVTYPSNPDSETYAADLEAFNENYSNRNDPGSELQPNLVQYFTGGKKTAGNIYIPLTYSLESDSEKYGDSDYIYGNNIRINKNGSRYFVKSIDGGAATSSSQSEPWKDSTASSEESQNDDETVYVLAKNRNQICKIKWTVDCSGAVYPNNANKLTGTIIAGTYSGLINNYFDATLVKKNGIKDYLQNWSSAVRQSGVVAPSGGFTLRLPNTTDHSSASDGSSLAFSNAGISLPGTYSYKGETWTMTETSSGSHAYTNKKTVLLYIKRNSEFNLKYLPTLTVGYHTLECAQFMTEIADLGGGLGGWVMSWFMSQNTVDEIRETSIMLPWQNVVVKDKNDNVLEGGFAEIDTSKKGMYYKLSLSFQLRGQYYEPYFESHEKKLLFIKLYEWKTRETSSTPTWVGGNSGGYTFTVDVKVVIN
ncbi:MAG: hypothetical protein J5781_06915 [Clostridia bacterium]|nr:hypothetical protein [Clostridia bacterium]